MEQYRHPKLTLNEQIKVIGAGILTISALAPVSVTAESSPTQAVVEAAYIPEELDYLPNNDATFHKLLPRR